MLLIRPESRAGYNLQTIDLTVHKDSACVGPPPAVKMLERLTGYDPVVVHWCLTAMGHRGYLYNVHSKQLMDMSQAMPQPVEDWYRRLLFKLHAVSSAIFLFFCISTLVSFTLRETQSRMLRFTYLLQHHTRHELPIFVLVFTHVTESLLFVPVMVGLHFFLKSFFCDQLLSFFVTSLVWCAEVFSVVSLRTKLATNFFPRVFAIYLSFFLLYFFHFPCGFNYLALTVAVLFTLHAMLYCMNTLEIPALEAGIVNERARRESLQGDEVSSLEREAANRRGSGVDESTGAGSGSGSGGSDSGEGPEATTGGGGGGGGTAMGSQSTPPRQRQSVQSASVDGGTVQFHGGRERRQSRQSKATPELERRRKAANELLALRGPEPCMRRTPPRPSCSGTGNGSSDATQNSSSSTTSAGRTGSIPVTPGLSWPAWLWGAEDPRAGEGEGRGMSRPPSTDYFGHMKSEESLFYTLDD